MANHPLAQALLGLSVLVGSSALPVAALAQTIVEDGVVTRKEAAPKRLSGIDVEEHLRNWFAASL